MCETASVEKKQGIRCNMCMSYYQEEDLERMHDERGALDGCLECETDAYLMDIELDETIEGIVHGSDIVNIKRRIRELVPEAEIRDIHPSWEPSSNEEHFLLIVEFYQEDKAEGIKDAIRESELVKDFQERTEDGHIIRDTTS